MNIVRYDPFHELTPMQRHWLFHHNQNVDQLYGSAVQGEETQSTGSTWTPLVDVFEDSETITLKVELPEVEAKAVDIRIEGNALTLRGERKLERADNREGYHRIERNYGSFGRTFTLPSTVEVGDITAESRDGVLRISLPKKAETKSRQIEVRTDSGRAGRDPQKQ
jgi:HSP20 family protein